MKKIILTITLMLSSIFSEEVYVELNKKSLENNFNSYLKKDIEKTEQNIKKTNTVKKMGLISPILVNYNNTKTEQNSIDVDSENYIISWTQSLWESGGILNKLKYYNKTEEVDLEKLKVLKNQKSAILREILKNIQDISLRIKQNRLNEKNKQIELTAMEENYRNGLIDIFMLNNVIIEKETIDNQLIDLKIAKLNLEKELKKDFSIIDIHSISLNHYLFPKEQIFLNNFKLSVERKKIELYDIEGEMNKSKYRPNLSFNTSYSEDLNSNIENYTYGLNLSMKFHPNMVKEKELNKVKVLKQKNKYEDELNKMKIIYKIEKEKSKIIKEKEDNLKRIINILENKIKAIKEDVENGLRTQIELEVLENSVKKYKIDQVRLKIQRDIIVIRLFS